MESLVHDLRYALRMLRKNPGFTAVAVLTLALGIGANTAIFSLINTVLLRPLPVAEPKRIVEITPLKKGADFANFSYPIYKDFRDRNDVLDGMAAYRFAPMSLSFKGNNERIWGYLVSGNYFDVLGVRPFNGRFFTQEEDRVPGVNPVVVVSYGCWQRRFGGDPNFVGQEITVNSHRFTVVGIAPEGFRGTVLIFTPEIWVPIMMARQIEPGSNWLEARRSGVLFAFGRLKPNVTEARAAASLSVLMANLGREYAQDERFSVTISPPGLVLPVLRNGTLNFSWFLMAIVALVLMIACTNLASLLLAGAAGRRKEIAVRLSLGASRAQLVRQLLTESALLALAGGAVGWLLALWLVDLVTALKPPLDFALTIDLNVDWRVLLFTLVLSVLTGVTFGLAPALQATKPDVISALKDETAAAGHRRSRLGGGLVVAQVALSLVLLVVSGLIVRSLQKVRAIGPGFEPEHAVTMSVDLKLQGYTEKRGLEFCKQLMTRIEALPGVRAASLTNYLPLALDRSSVNIYIEGQTVARNADVPEAQNSNVWSKYFETMGIPLLQGREFTEGDGKKGAPHVAIINQTFARRFWPGQNPIGKRLRIGRPQGALREVVGVVKNGKYWSLGEGPQPFIYFPMERDCCSSAALVARTSGDPRALIRAIRREVQRLDASLPVFDVKTMDEHMRLSLFPLRTGAWIAGGFALIALTLATLGLYGVMAYSVSQRTREIGIRMALGARRKDVLGLVLKQGMRLALVGLCIGLAGALAATRLMSAVLYGVSPTDAVTFALVSSLLAAAVLMACFIPARRATKIDPMVALRYE